MAQKTSWTGAALSQTDINTYLMGEGGAWTTWTPTVTQSGSVTVTVNTATYGRWGRMIIARMQVTVTGSGTAANAVVIGGLPATAVVSVGAFGQGYLYDSSVPSTFPALVTLASSTTLQLTSTQSTASDSRLGIVSFTAGLASGDIINLSLTYEAAS